MSVFGIKYGAQVLPILTQRRFEKLTQLELRGLIISDDVTISTSDFFLQIINQFAANLTWLDISECDEFDDNALLVVAQNCSSLTYLNISECSAVTTTGLMVWLFFVWLCMMKTNRTNQIVIRKQ